MYGLLDISASGMVAQRTRIDMATVNLANANSIIGPGEDNTPFRRRIAILATGDPRSGKPDGVHVQSIIQSDEAFTPKHMPSHPLADENGMVMTPAIDTTTELVNGMEASRAYEANVMAAEATKSLIASSLRLLA